MIHHISGTWFIEDEEGNLRPLSSTEQIEGGLVVGCE